MSNEVDLSKLLFGKNLTIGSMKKYKGRNISEVLDDFHWTGMF